MTAYRVFVAGRSGQVARELAGRTPHGLEVISSGRPDFDLTDEQSVRDVISRLKPDIVVNAAAYTAVDQAENDEASAYALNAYGAGYLARSAHEVDAPILHISTDYVFDGTKSVPYTEDDPVAPLGVYGRSKQAGEDAVLFHNPASLVLRTSWVYSPYGKNFVKTMLRLASSREEVGVVHDQRGNPTAASEIARGIWSIVTALKEDRSALSSGIYHMSGGGEASWAEFAEAVFDYSRKIGGPSADVKRISSADYPTPVRRPVNSQLDCTKLSRDYGIILPEWRLSAQQCVEELIRTKGWQV